MAVDGTESRGTIVVVGCQGKKLGLEVGDIAGIKYMEDFILAEIPQIIQNEQICIKHVISYQGETILVLDINKFTLDT